MSGPKRFIEITDHFTCTSANVICYITCTYRKKSYIGQTGRRQGDQFWEHLRNVERNDKDASKPVVRLKSHCSFSLLLGSSKEIRKESKQFESRKTSEQKFIFQIAKVYLYFLHKNTHTTHNSSIRSDEWLTLETSALKLFTVDNLRY